MSQDISYIRKAIRSCEEVYSPYDIKIGQHVKYITLEDNSEFFYEGGIYVKMGDNKIVLKNGNKYIYVPLIFKHPDGYILYKTRLFVENEEEDNFDELSENNENQLSMEEEDKLGEESTDIEKSINPEDVFAEVQIHLSKVY